MNMQDFRLKMTEYDNMGSCCKLTKLIITSFEEYVICGGSSQHLQVVANCIRGQ